MSKFKTLALCALMGVLLAFTACDDSANSAPNSQNATNSSANSAANGENSANSAANLAQNSQNGVNLNQNSAQSVNSSQNSAQDLSKYRALYAKPTSEWARPELDPSVEKEWQEFAPIPRPIAPADNQFAGNKAYLGRKLFRDPRLSKSGQFACESCHHMELESTDGLPVAFGHDFQMGRRNTPSSQMAGFFDELFWDGRAKGLEEQALGPITDPVEMANTLENAERTIKNTPEYYPYFVAAFGDEALQKAWAEYYAWVAPKKEDGATRETMPQKPEFFSIGIEKLGALDAAALNELKEQEDELFSIWTFHRLLNDKSMNPQGAKPPKVPQNLINSAKKLITIENIAKAIATFERGPGVMGARNSRFERFIKGDYEILSDKELWGLDLFRNKGRCANCHYGFLLSDKKFHNIGLDLYGRAGQDLGRYEVTKNPADIGAFKTPTLVNVAKTAPYMHNGSSPNLKGVIQLFNNGVEVPAVGDANLTAIAQRDGANVAGGGILSAEGVKNSAGGGGVAGINSSGAAAGAAGVAAAGNANSSVAGAAGKNAASVAVERKKLVVDKDGKVLKPTKSPLIHPLNLSADEIEALEAFLRTL